MSRDDGRFNAILPELSTCQHIKKAIEYTFCVMSRRAGQRKQKAVWEDINSCLPLTSVLSQIVLVKSDLLLECTKWPKKVDL